MADLLALGVCPTPKPFRITMGAVRDGRVCVANFQPPCDVLTCPACKANRMQAVAGHLLNVAGGGVLHVAKTTGDIGQAVKRGYDRAKGDREDAGRLVVTLEGGNFHVSNVDCFTRKRASGTDIKATTAGVDKVILALRSPALPVTRSGRWVGAWRPRPEEAGDQLFLLSLDAKGDMRREFCAAYSIRQSFFSGSHSMDLHDPELWRIIGAMEWWRINRLGLAPRLYRGTAVIPTPPPFVFRDERRPALTGVDISGHGEMVQGPAAPVR